MSEGKGSQKTRLQTLEVSGKVLVTNFNERGGPRKRRAFQKQKVYKIPEQEDEVVLVYIVREESDPRTPVRVLHQTIYSHANNLTALKNQHSC